MPTGASGTGSDRRSDGWAFQPRGAAGGKSNALAERTAGLAACPAEDGPRGFHNQERIGSIMTAGQSKSRQKRRANQLRAVRIKRHFTAASPGSVLLEMGDTVVLCTASVEDQVPAWMQGSGRGWMTAEYNMLPHSTTPRKRRDRGKVDGRTTEIQRLIGRSLRAVADLDALGERTITIDCDVLQADGGTRTASITGGWVALADALDRLVRAGALSETPLIAQVGQFVEDHSRSLS